MIKVVTAKTIRRRYLKKFQAALVIGCFWVAMQPAFAADKSIDGMWKMGDGKLVVKVDRCTGNKICVKIASIAKAFHDDGTPRLDDKNPNPALRSRPVVGLQIIDDLAPTGDNTWKGRLYNSDDGRTYTAYATLRGGSRFEVKGCWGPFCKSLQFVR
jgi:uncharacterized protein (DUF2147 family)